ncbi:hypothetical protein VTN77DRAFT_6838 [Rasamsonia byssochlamydoides]|uniref:uncharacterized protein n=1 Tax=Rasamsonia byssochlamydoides TaxID=89139 RepID=UPI0037420FBA
MRHLPSGMSTSLGSVPFTIHSLETESSVPHNSRSRDSARASGKKKKKETLSYKDNGYSEQLELRDIEPRLERPDDTDPQLSNLGALREFLKRPNPIPKGAEKCDTAKAVQKRAQNENTFSLALSFLIDLKTFIKIEGLNFVVNAAWADTHPLPSSLPSSLRIAPPAPDVTIGYQSSAMKDLRKYSRELGKYSAPVICDSDLLFPFVTIGVKGDAGRKELALQNSHNGAVMLRNLRHLREKARSNAQETFDKTFDDNIRALTLGIHKFGVDVTCHWTSFKDGQVVYCSAILRTWNLIKDNDWYDARAGIRLAITWMMEENQSWIKADLASIKNSKQLRSTRAQSLINRNTEVERSHMTFVPNQM